MTKRFKDEDRVDESSRNYAAVTTSDVDDLPFISRRISIGGAGTLSVIDEHGATHSFGAYPAGHVFKLRATRVRTTGTSATAIIAYFD
jgi:hypothetical protein